MPLTSLPAKSPQKSDKHVPRHRAPGKHKAARSLPARMVRTSVVLTGVAAAATGVDRVGRRAGRLARGRMRATWPRPRSAASPSPRPTPTRAPSSVASRVAPVSRSDRRGATDATKAPPLSPPTGAAVTRTEDLSDERPARHRPGAAAGVRLRRLDQFGCLDSL